MTYDQLRPLSSSRETGLGLTTALAISRGKSEKCGPGSLGLEEDLVSLGRAVYREAFNHSSDSDSQAECGWGDDREQMIQYALVRPEAMRQRWIWILRSDGERIHPTAHQP
jgi:hypothetical protein